MDITELLSSEILKLPKERKEPSEEDYEKFIRNLFCKYLATVEGLAANDWPTQELKTNRKVLEDLCDGICSALDRYFDGFPAQAYKELEVALN